MDFFFLGTFLLHNKENTSLLLGWCSHHEVAVADTADELLEEIPRLVGLTKKIEKKKEEKIARQAQRKWFWFGGKQQERLPSRSRRLIGVNERSPRPR